MNNNVSSREYAKLVEQSLTLIGDIRAAQQKLETTLDLASELGVNIKQGDTETNIAYLARIAADATEKKHDQQKAESLEEIAKETEGLRSSRKRTIFGRALNSLANLAG